MNESEISAVVETPRDKFLAYMMQGSQALDVPPQQLLDEDETLRQRFCAAYFLADTRSGHDALYFVSETVPRLLREFHRATHQQRITYEGEVRGRVDWAATYKARYQNEVNPALFVCRQPQRHDDTPENQLLKYLLVGMERLLHDYSPAVLAAEQLTGAGVVGPEWLQARLHAASHHLRAVLAHVHLRYVETPDTIASRHLQRALTSKMELYSRVATFYGRYEQVVLRYRWQAIRPILKQTILLPHPDHPHSDLFMRLAAIGLLGDGPA